MDEKRGDKGREWMNGEKGEEEKKEKTGKKERTVWTDLPSLIS